MWNEKLRSKSGLHFLVTYLQYLLLYFIALVDFIGRAKQNWKCWYSCIAESFWKTLLPLVFGLIPWEIDLCGSPTLSGTGRMCRILDVNTIKITTRGIIRYCAPNTKLCRITYLLTMVFWKVHFMFVCGMSSVHYWWMRSSQFYNCEGEMFPFLGCYRSISHKIGQRPSCRLSQALGDKKPPSPILPRRTHKYKHLQIPRGRGARDIPPGQNIFIFMQFWGKIAKITG